MIDIDNFKLYNDTFGHLEGDKCLAQVAEKIGSCARRKTDFAARVGGEEFLVFLYDIPKAEVHKKAEELQEKINSLQIPHSKENFRPFVSVSVGVAARPSGRGIEFVEFRKEADECLYTAKHQGRARVCGVEVLDTTPSVQVKIEEADEFTASESTNHLDMARNLA